jgi:hypothetical protein
MPYSLADMVLACLQEQPEVKKTAREIADYILRNFPDECAAKKANSSNLTTDDELIAQLIAEIGSRRPSIQRRIPAFKNTEGRPRKYYYSDKSDEAEILENESLLQTNAIQANANKSGEHDLYPLLSQYLKEEFDLYSARIDEKRSSNRRGPNGNRWLYPDVVGVEALCFDWNIDVRDCVKQYSDKLTKLWSFEVKVLINRSNVRECFFQTVSNSSWANFGYLVAAEIEGRDTLNELRMLFAAHGIGVIRLDRDNPTESQILIPAREKDEIDWNMVNRLATENTDFLDYIKKVKDFYLLGGQRPSYWGEPISIE